MLWTNFNDIFGRMGWDVMTFINTTTTTTTNNNNNNNIPSHSSKNVVKIRPQHCISYPADRQTDRRTNTQKQKYNLIGEDNN